MSRPHFMPRVRPRPGRLAFAIFFGALLALQCLLPSAAFARSSGRATALAPNSADFIRDAAGVSVVRLVANYGDDLDNALACTALGILVGSGPVPGTTPTVYRNWLLTDASLVNSSVVACGTPGGLSVLDTIQIWASDEYTSSAAEPVMLGELGSCKLDRNGGTTCKNVSGGSTESVTVSSVSSMSYTLLSFQTSSWQPYLSLNTGKVATPALNVGLTDTTGKPAVPTLVDSGALRTHLQPTIVPASVGTGDVATTPQATGTSGGAEATPTGPAQGDVEGGTPIVDATGKLVGIFTNDATRIEINQLPAVVITEITALIATKAEAPNPLKTGWDSGIAAYYAGDYPGAHEAFKSILKTTAQFTAPQKFDKLAVAEINRSGNQGGSGSGTKSSGDSQLLLILLGAGLGVLILLLILVTILVGRARKRRRELERFAVEQREAQRQAEEEIQRQRAQAQAAAPTEVLCPNCRKPVKTSDAVCIHCRYPLSPTASGMGVRLAGTSPLPALPPASSPMPAAMPTRSPLPISEQPTIQFPPSPAAATVSSTEKTQKQRKRTVKAQAGAANSQGAQMGLKLVAATRSDPGLKRKHKPNEDSVFAMQGARKQQPFGLFVVADGMGGHANGQDASRLAIQTMINFMLPRMSDEAVEDEAFRDMLGHGVQEANQAVHQRNLEAHGDMGTTMTTALIVGNTAYVANVGDSRTYLYREGQGLSKVTQDHSVVASLVEAGIIKPDDIYTHPKRNQIYRSLGEKPQVEVDTFKVELHPGDKLLLCSDGLWDMVRDPLIQQVMSKGAEDPNKTGQELIKAALQGGGEDNVSVIVLQISETDQQVSVSNFQLLAAPDTVTVPTLPQTK